MQDASKIEEQITQLAQELRPAVEAELRRFLSERVTGIAQDVEDDGLEALAPDGCGQPTPVDVVDVDSFVEGMRYACRLFADPELDY